VENVNPERLEENLASVEGLIRNFSTDLDTKKTLEAHLVSTLVLKTECLETLKSPTISIVLLGEYGMIRKEIKEIRQELRRTRNEIKVLAEQLMKLKLERGQLMKLLKKTERPGEPCGKVLEFKSTKTPTKN
jgi:hypothetical protein